MSLFIVSFSASCLYYTLETIGVRGQLNLWDFSLLYSSLLIVPSFYFFIVYLINPTHRLSLIDKLLFVPYGMQILIQLFGSFWVIVEHEFIIKHQFKFYKFYDSLDLTTLILSLILLILAVRKIKQYDKSLQANYAEIGEYSLHWILKLLVFLGAVLLLFAIPIIYELVTGNSPMNIYYPLWIASSALIYWIGYSTIFRKQNSPEILVEQTIKEESISLSDNTKIYHERLLDLMEKERLYLTQDLNLRTLAEKMNLSGGYLSQIINQYEGKNFFEFINSYRVEVVKQKIMSEEYAHLNLLGIAYESGFKSKSTFNLAFKKITGQTPSAFKKASLITKKTS